MAEEMTESQETSEDTKTQSSKSKHPFFKKMLKAFSGIFAGLFTLGIYPIVKRRIDRKRNRPSPVSSMDEIYGDFDPDKETTVEHVSSDEIASEKGSEEHSRESSENHENHEHQSRQEPSKTQFEEEKEREI